MGALVRILCTLLSVTEITGKLASVLLYELSLKFSLSCKLNSDFANGEFVTKFICGFQVSAASRRSWVFYIFTTIRRALFV